MCMFLGSINTELMPEYFHAAYMFGCKRNTAISDNKPKYTFLLVTSVYEIAKITQWLDRRFDIPRFQARLRL